MTGSQRKTHVVLWLVLGPVAVIGLVLALAWRPPTPVQDGELPGVTDEQAAAEQAADGTGVSP